MTHIIMPRGGATAYGVCLFVCLAFRLWHQFCSARWKLRVETCNSSRTRYYLAFQHLKMFHTKLCSRVMAWRDLLPWRPLQTLWLPLKSKLVLCRLLTILEPICTATVSSKMTELTVLCCQFCAIFGTHQACLWSPLACFLPLIVRGDMH